MCEYKLLCVDDDDNFRSGTRSLLYRLRRQMSVELLEASSGAEAMNILSEQNVDCVLLDYKMPGGSGLDWLEKMLAEYPSLAVIMVTGDGSEEVAVYAMKRGAVDYLVKGAISAEALQRAVMNGVEKVRMRKALLIAEQHRVMIESLGAACHHLGQPMSVVNMYLSILKKRGNDKEDHDLLVECEKAVDSVNDILRRLQEVSVYRTEPYMVKEDCDDSASDARILAI